MVKITRVDKVTKPIYYIQTDEEDYPSYRRYDGGSWEQSMGESWETVYIREKELESAFQMFLMFGGQVHESQ
jgi:hypothetical protein